MDDIVRPSRSCTFLLTINYWIFIIDTNTNSDQRRWQLPHLPIINGPFLSQQSHYHFAYDGEAYTLISCSLHRGIYSLTSSQQNRYGRFNFIFFARHTPPKFDYFCSQFPLSNTIWRWQIEYSTVLLVLCSGNIQFLLIPFPLPPYRIWKWSLFAMRITETAITDLT